MGIEQAFGFGREAEIVYVGQRADYAPYEERIAYLEGQVRGYKKAYDRDIAELTDVARRNKELAEKNSVIVDLFRDTLLSFIAQGRPTREEVNATKDEIKSQLPYEELELLLK